MTKNSFSKFIEALRNTPIEIDNWRYSQVGKKNDGPYKANYQSLKLCKQQSFDRLVDVSRYGIASCDFHLDEFFNGVNDYKDSVIDGTLFSRSLLRDNHAKRLAKADAILRCNNLFLYVASGWRHPVIQEKSKSLYAKYHGKETAGQMFASVGEDIAPAPHSTGAVADLAILELSTGKALPMYVTLDGNQIFNLYYLEEIAAINPDLLSKYGVLEYVKNRRILYHLLCTLGVAFDEKEDLFIAHPGEFWHYGDGDPLSAFLNREPCARYGEIYPDTKSKSLFVELSPP